MLTGALDGIHVLELGRVPPAELPGMMLSDMGAEVLKIETPREIGPMTAEARREAAHTYTNRNKRSIGLDLKAPEGAKLFSRLALDADVIVEGFRPGVMARLGADYETVSKSNPRIVYCSISGFGQAGPYRKYPAHDLNFLGLAFRFPDQQTRLIVLDAALEQAKFLVELLRLHVFREDNVIFPLAQQLLTPTEFEEMSV